MKEAYSVETLKRKAGLYTYSNVEIMLNHNKSNSITGQKIDTIAYGVDFLTYGNVVFGELKTSVQILGSLWYSLSY